MSRDQSNVEIERSQHQAEEEAERTGIELGEPVDEEGSGEMGALPAAQEQQKAARIAWLNASQPSINWQAIRYGNVLEDCSD